MQKLADRKSQAGLDDRKIVELYFLRSTDAIAETDRKYRKYLMTVAKNILHSSFDCEECLNDTYLSAWDAIPPANPNSLKAFLTVILRRIAVNRYHFNSKKSKIPSEMTVSLSDVEEIIKSGGTEQDFDAQSLGKIISGFVSTLSPRKQYIFMSRFYLATPVLQIAADLNLSKSTVSKELTAIKSDLKQVLEKEDYFL